MCGLAPSPGSTGNTLILWRKKNIHSIRLGPNCHTHCTLAKDTEGTPQQQKQVHMAATQLSALDPGVSGHPRRSKLVNHLTHGAGVHI